MQLTEIGSQIQEVMESYELTLPTTIRGYNTYVSDNNGSSTSTETYQVKCCRNLHGHSIGQYEIHGGKSVPIVANGDTTRMVEHEMYAIETFGSTGEGYVREEGECSHYMQNYTDKRKVPLKQAKSRSLYSHINKTFSSLAFCRRWLERMDGGSYTVNKHNVSWWECCCFCCGGGMGVWGIVCMGMVVCILQTIYLSIQLHILYILYILHIYSPLFLFLTHIGQTRALPHIP